MTMTVTMIVTLTTSVTFVTVSDVYDDDDDFCISGDEARGVWKCWE